MRDRLAHPKSDFIIGEQACKPDPVPRRAGVAIIHLGRGIASGLQRPTRGSPLVPASRDEVAERATPPPLFGLAPCGVFPAPEVALRAVRSYIKSRQAGPHLFTLTPAVFRQPCGRRAAALGRYIFCGTVRIGKTPWPLAQEARPTLAVSQHTALRSPDFPLPGEPGSDHPACSPNRHQYEGFRNEVQPTQQATGPDAALLSTFVPRQNESLARLSPYS